MRPISWCAAAASNHFAHEVAGSKNYTSDGAYVARGPTTQPSGTGAPLAQWYSTDFYTQQLISYIHSNKDDGKPFFAYAAYTSPHWPLQVPEPWLSKDRGRYDQTYDAIREARVTRQNLGIIPYSWTPHRPEPETLTRPPATADNGTAAAKYTSAVHSPVDGYVDYGGGCLDKSWNSLTALEQKSQAQTSRLGGAIVITFSARSVARFARRQRARGASTRRRRRRSSRRRCASAPPIRRERGATACTSRYENCVLQHGSAVRYVGQAAVEQLWVHGACCTRDVTYSQSGTEPSSRVRQRFIRAAFASPNFVATVTRALLGDIRIRRHESSTP